MSDRDDLGRLLEGADGVRDLPPGVEEKLLASVLRTAAQPRAEDATVEDGRAVRVPVDELGQRRRRSTPLTTLVAAAAAVGIIIGLAAIWPTPAPPSVTGGGPAGELAPVDVRAIDLETLCALADFRIEELQLDAARAPVDSGDAGAMRELAVTLDELAERGERTEPPMDDQMVNRARDAASVLRLAAAQTAADDLDEATRTRSRAAVLVLGPADESARITEQLGCQSPTPSG